MKKRRHQPPVAKHQPNVEDQFTRILGYDLAVVQRDLIKTMVISSVLIGVVLWLSFYLR